MKKSTAGKKKIVIIAAFVILIAVMAAMFMIVRYTPTKEKMNGYTYFDLDQSTDKTMVIVDENSIQIQELCRMEDIICRRNL